MTLRTIIKTLRQPWWLALLACGLLALLLRGWQLADFPRGLHFDEAWFGYHAWLLRHWQINIYGQHWPFSMDMFGDMVPALHAYYTIPFISIFGLNALGIRAATVGFALISWVLAVWLIWRLSRGHRPVTLLGAFLFAISPVNIVMSRASSTVIMDTAVLLGFLAAYTETLLLLTRTPHRPWWQIGGGLLGTYLLSILAYSTYFTSRLILPPMALGLWLWFWYQHRQPWRRWIWGLLPIVLYVIFPFLVLLRTPYAMGRFSQTTVWNNQTVQFELTNRILQAGQAHWPLLLTRAVFNKITVNIEAVAEQYLGLLSPTNALWQIQQPPRYRMPTLGALTMLEYGGFWLAIMAVVLSGRPFRRWRGLALLWGSWALLALIPSALTVDDYPNWQRAVIITPFWQMTAAVGLWFLYENIKSVWPKNQLFIKLWTTVAGVALAVTTLGTSGLLITNYTLHARYFDPYYRNVASWAAGQWINQHHDEPMVATSLGMFLFPYFQAQEAIPLLPVQKTAKSFLLASEFKIGQRQFVRDLCQSAYLFSSDYNYAIFNVRADCFKMPWWLIPVTHFDNDGGVAEFAVYRPDKAALAQLRQEYAQLQKQEAQLSKQPIPQFYNTFWDKVWSSQPPVTNK